MEKYSLRGGGVNLMHDFFNVLSDPLLKIIFLDNNRKNYMLSWPILVEKKNIYFIVLGGYLDLSVEIWFFIFQIYYS